MRSLNLNFLTGGTFLSCHQGEEESLAFSLLTFYWPALPESESAPERFLLYTHTSIVWLHHQVLFSLYSHLPCVLPESSSGFQKCAWVYCRLALPTKKIHEGENNLPKKEQGLTSKKHNVIFHLHGGSHFPIHKRHVNSWGCGKGK